MIQPIQLYTENRTQPSNTGPTHTTSELHAYINDLINQYPNGEVHNKHQSQSVDCTTPDWVSALKVNGPGIDLGLRVHTGSEFGERLGPKLVHIPKGDGEGTREKERGRGVAFPKGWDHTRGIVTGMTRVLGQWQGNRKGEKRGSMPLHRFDDAFH